MNQSALTVRLSSSSTVAVWPDLLKKVVTILFAVLRLRLNFTGTCSKGNSQTDDWAFVSGSNWCIQVSSPVTISQTDFDVPPSNFCIIILHQLTRALFCSLVSSWGTHREQRLLTPNRSCKMVIAPADPMPRICSISRMVTR